jgi:ficolin
LFIQKVTATTSKISGNVLNVYFTGTAGDSLSYHNGMKFSTKDVDNDQKVDLNCAEDLHGAWWFKTCHYSHLNGEYVGAHVQVQAWHGVFWFHFRGHLHSAKIAEMKVGRDRNEPSTL